MTFKPTEIVLPDDMYSATVVDIEKREPQEGSAFQRPFRLWHVVVKAEDYPDGAEMTAVTSMAFGPKSKARPWVQALLGRPIKPKEEISAEDFLPAKCRVLIRRDEKSGFCRIEDILPPDNRNGNAESGADGVTL
jgi:hypothetical protein